MTDSKQRAKNLAFFDSVRKTPDEHTKAFQIGKEGFKGTTWDPSWAIRECTALWGVYGGSWGLRNMQWIPLLGDRGSTIGMALTCDFHCPLIELPYPVAVDLNYRPTGHTFKCLQTAAIKRALRYLGFAYDIYLGEYDDDEMVSTDPKHRTPSTFAREAIAGIKSAKSHDAVTKVETFVRTSGISAAKAGDIYDAAKKRHEELVIEDSASQAEDVIGEGNYGKGQEDTDMPASGLSPRTDQ